MLYRIIYSINIYFEIEFKMGKKTAATKRLAVDNGNFSVKSGNYEKAQILFFITKAVYRFSRNILIHNKMLISKQIKLRIYIVNF